MRGLLKFILTLGVFAVVWQGLQSIQAQSLAEKLLKLESMRKGPNTAYAEVEARARDLLSEYTAREEQGDIYHSLACVYLFSGLQTRAQMDRAIECIKKALEFNEKPYDRMHLYQNWSCVVRLMGPNRRTTPENRKAAAEILLKGLKEAKDYDLPEVKPERMSAAGGGAGLGERDPVIAAEAKRKNDAEVAEYERVEHERKLCDRRDGHFELFRMTYQGPSGMTAEAKAELRVLATKILDDPVVVEKVMKAAGASDDQATK